MWSQFRGPNASGIAGAQPSLPVSFGPGKNELWKTPVHPGASSPCIWEDRVFLTDYDKDAKQLGVLCINRKDGRILWRVPVETKQIERFHPAGTPASATIATDGERVYAFFGSRGLLCHDFDGHPIWTIDLPLPDLANGSGTSPIVAGDLVLLNREENGSPHLLAVNKMTGVEVWRYDYLYVPGEYHRGSATPIIWNGQVIVHTHDGLHGVSLSDGKPIWRAGASTNGVATPVISGNKLYVSTWQPLGEESERGEIPTFEELLEHDSNNNGAVSFQEFPGHYTLFYRPESSEDYSKRVPLKFAFRLIDAGGDGEIDQDEWKQATQVGMNKLKEHGLLSIELGGRGDITATHVKIILTERIPEVPSPLPVRGVFIWSRMAASSIASIRSRVSRSIGNASRLRAPTTHRRSQRMTGSTSPPTRA